MAKQINLREASKVYWSTPVDKGNYPCDTNIQLGCLMRIADASENMAKNYTKLQNDYDYMRNSRDSYRDEYLEAQRRISAYKGVITKMRRKMDAK